MKADNYTIIAPEAIQNSMMGNKEMIKQFVQLYLTQSAVDFQNLENSIRSKVKSDIASSAHHIKPTMEYIGAIDLRTAFQQLETLAKQDADLTHIMEKFEMLKPSFEIMLQELKVFLDQL